MKEINIPVATMVIVGLICVIGSASATTTEAAIGPTAAATIGVALFLGIITIGAAVLFMRWSAKKSPDYKAGRLIKALNGIVHRMTAVDATYTETVMERVATSPRVLLHKT